MKKLFILTVLFSVANLSALSYDEANARLSSAQNDHKTALMKAKEHEVALKHAFNLAQTKPGKESYAALESAIAAHNQTVDHCKQCVHGIQSALKDVNARGHFVHGDAWQGKVAPAA